MPLDPSISLNANPGDPMSKLSSMLDMANSMQRLKMGQASQKLTEAQTQQQLMTNDQLQQATDERHKLTSAFQDPKAPFKNPDGSIDYTKLNNWIPANAPLTGNQYGNAFMDAAAKQNAFSYSKLLSSNADRAAIASVARSFIAPDGSLRGSPDDFMRQMGTIPVTDQSKPYVQEIGNMFRHIGQVQGPDQNGGNAQESAFKNALSQISSVGETAGEQAQTDLAGNQILDTGGQQGLVNRNPASPAGLGKQVGIATSNTLPPAQRTQSFDSPNGPVFVHRKPDGTPDQSYGINAIPGGAEWPTPQNQADLNQVQKEVADLRTSAANVGQIKSLTTDVQNLLKSNQGNLVANAGPGSSAYTHIAALFSSLFPGDGSVTRYTSGAQLLDALQARIGGMMAQQMGMNGTDAGRQLSQQMAGNPRDMGPQALAEKTHILQGQLKSMELYTNAVNDPHVVGTGANQNWGNYRSFQNYWRQNYNFDVFRLAADKENGDQADYNAILEKYRSGKGPESLKSLQQKVTNLAPFLGQ